LKKEKCSHETGREGECLQEPKAQQISGVRTGHWGKNAVAQRSPTAPEKEREEGRGSQQERMHFVKKNCQVFEKKTKL